jgi:hypothetical protein
MPAMSGKRPENSLPAAAAATLALFLLLPVAQARSEREASYPFERAWPTAVRFLRIDEGFSIIERDPDSGYVLFELKDDGRTFTGSMEVVRTEDDAGRRAVRIVLRIADRPAYMERGILERLARKLRADLGDPAPPPEPPEEKEPPSKKDGDKGEKREGEKEKKDDKAPKREVDKKD